MDDNNGEALAVKAALMETTRTLGWQHIVKLGESICQRMEQKALREEDDVKAIGYRRDAKGARAFMEELFKQVEISKLFDASNDTFLEICN